MTIYDLNTVSRELPPPIERFVADCPLDCERIALFWLDGKAAYVEHKGTHPQSTRCGWSRQLAPPEQTVHLKEDVPI